MRVVSEKELNKEMEYLEKQKQIIAEERERIMLERSKIYYEWKDIEQEKQDIAIERNRINEARANVGKELEKLNKEIKDAKNLEIERLKNEFISIEKQLDIDRQRLDKIRFDLAEQTAIEESNLINKKQKNLI
jgi:hypothetical protein